MPFVLTTLIARMDAAGEGDQVIRLQDPEFVWKMLKKRFVRDVVLKWKPKSPLGRKILNGDFVCGTL